MPATWSFDFLRNDKLFPGGMTEAKYNLSGNSKKEGNNMLNMKKISLVGALVATMTVSAHAISITPATIPQWTGSDNSNLNASELSAFLATQGVVVSLTQVYKQDQGAGSDSGTFASSYTTTFSNTASDPSDALIDYISGPSITGGSIFLYVKDGNHDPAFYVFDISAWNGTDDLSLTGFWPNGGAISHVTILTGNGTSVPDAGGTLTLLGLAIGSLGLIRSKRNV
jgi:hypothetical protein